MSNAFVTDVNLMIVKQLHVYIRQVQNESYVSKPELDSSHLRNTSNAGDKRKIFTLQFIIRSILQILEFKIVFNMCNKAYKFLEMKTIIINYLMIDELFVSIS